MQNPPDGCLNFKNAPALSLLGVDVTNENIKNMLAIVGKGSFYQQSPTVFNKQTADVDVLNTVLCTCLHVFCMFVCVVFARVCCCFSMCCARFLYLFCVFLIKNVL